MMANKNLSIEDEIVCLGLETMQQLQSSDEAHHKAPFGLDNCAEVAGSFHAKIKFYPWIFHPQKVCIKAFSQLLHSSEIETEA